MSEKKKTEQELIDDLVAKAVDKYLEKAAKKQKPQEQEEQRKPYAVCIHCGYVFYDYEEVARTQVCPNCRSINYKVLNYAKS